MVVSSSWASEVFYKNIWSLKVGFFVFFLLLLLLLLLVISLFLRATAADLLQSWVFWYFRGNGGVRSGRNWKTEDNDLLLLLQPPLWYLQLSNSRCIRNKSRCSTILRKKKWREQLSAQMVNSSRGSSPSILHSCSFVVMDPFVFLWEGV